MAKDSKEKKGKAVGRGKWDAYDTQGELKRGLKACPKCGAGVFMAQHQDRLSCGKCGYTEFTRDKIIHVFPDHHKKEKPKEEKKEEAEEQEEEAPKKEGKKIVNI